MNENVTYKVESINQVLELLNRLTISGLTNIQIVSSVTQLLQNPIVESQVEKSNVDEVVTEETI